MDPWKKKMMDKAKNKKQTRHPVVPPLDLCVPASQDKEEDPIEAHMEKEGFHEVD